MTESRILVLSLLLLAASGVVYLPSLSGDYVYDDKRFVEENAAVSSGVGVLDYFTDASTQTADESWEGLYRPLRTLSFRGTALLADGPGGQRAVNLLIHLANVILVWMLLRGILGQEPRLPALLGALVFSLHPLATEAVAWISSRGDLLAMTGMIGALLLHRREKRWASTFVFGLALLAKESAIVTPLLAVLLDGYEGGVARIRARWKDHGILAGVLVAFIGVRYAVLGAEDFGQGYVRRENVVERASTILSGTLYYVRTMLFPAGLGFEVRILRGADARNLAMLGLLVSTLLVGGAFVSRHRTPRVSLAIFWFFAALIPVTLLQFVFPLKLAVANRFAYPAVFALGLLLALVAGRARAGAAFVVVVLLVFVPLSLVRADAFSTEEKLWTDVVAKDPGNAIAHFALGRLALHSGDPEKAREHLVNSAQVDPRHPQVHALLGETFEVLMQRERSHSPELSGYAVEAFNAYNAAVRMWEAGIEEDRAQLYGMTIVNAAYMAGVIQRPELLTEHALNLVTNRPPVPGTGPMRDRLLHRMTRISQYLGMIEQRDLAESVREAVEQLRKETR